MVGNRYAVVECCFDGVYHYVTTGFTTCANHNTATGFSRYSASRSPNNTAQYPKTIPSTILSALSTNTPSPLYSLCSKRTAEPAGKLSHDKDRGMANQPMVYQIRLEGHLGDQWTLWFEGLTITREEHGETVLTGPVADQAALYGLLRKVRDLGMPLLAVYQLKPEQAAAPSVKT